MENFEEKLSRLEELSDKIKQSDITLEEALKSFEEGIKLSKGIEKELDDIESKVQILMNAPVITEEKTKKRSKSKNTTDSNSDLQIDLFDTDTELNGTRAI